VGGRGGGPPPLAGRQPGSQLAEVSPSLGPCVLIPTSNINFYLFIYLFIHGVKKSSYLFHKEKLN
jgi:hypothetical protein